MAKKDKKQKSSRQAGKTKLPKDLRKMAETALALAQSPIAREVAAAALTAGAAALSKRAGAKPSGEPAPKIKTADIGNLLAQGVAAFVAGMGKPSDQPTDAKADSSDASRPGDRPGKRGA